MSELAAAVSDGEAIDWPLPKPAQFFDHQRCGGAQNSRPG